MPDYDSQEIGRLLADYCDLRGKVVGITSPEQAKNSADYGRFIDTQSRIRGLVLDGNGILDVLESFKLPKSERAKLEDLKEKVDGARKGLRALVFDKKGEFADSVRKVISSLDYR